MAHHDVGTAWGTSPEVELEADAVLGGPAIVVDPTMVLLSRFGRIVRSLSVSVLTTGLSLIILAVLTRYAVTSPVIANIVATAAGIGPSFALNRRWAWRRSGRGHVRRELVPFWGYALASLVVSTFAVARAAAWADATDAGPTMRTLVVLGANVGSFGTLWCGQFLLLDRLLVTVTDAADRRDGRPVAPEHAVAPAVDHTGAMAGTARRFTGRIAHRRLLRGSCEP